MARLADPKPIIFPSLLKQHYHLIVSYEKDCVMTREPEWCENLPTWFARNNASPNLFYWIPNHYEPVEKHPFDDPRRVCSRKNGMTTEVYFIEAKDVGLIKIGTSTSSSSRLDAIRLLSPVPLALLAVIKGNRKVEGALHRKFRHLRRHGEWFEDTLELRAFIEGCKRK
jgi:T5orf172 domain